MTLKGLLEPGPWNDALGTSLEMQVQTAGQNLCNDRNAAGHLDMCVLATEGTSLVDSSFFLELREPVQTVVSEGPGT